LLTLHHCFLNSRNILGTVNFKFLARCIVADCKLQASSLIIAGNMVVAAPAPALPQLPPLPQMILLYNLVRVRYDFSNEVAHREELFSLMVLRLRYGDLFTAPLWGVAPWNPDRDQFGMASSA
jgi:hypothetical protein